MAEKKGDAMVAEQRVAQREREVDSDTAVQLGTTRLLQGEFPFTVVRLHLISRLTNC